MLTQEEKYAIAQNVIERQGHGSFGQSVSQGQYELYLNTSGGSTPTLFLEADEERFKEKVKLAGQYREFIEKNYHGLMQRLLDELEIVNQEWAEAAL